MNDVYISCVYIYIYRYIHIVYVDVCGLSPWKKSSDKTRQRIKKQRHHFANKVLYSQRCGFSSSHVWM